MSPITIQGDEETLTWNPAGSGISPEWFGNETLRATRIGKYYVLGNQDTKGLQPKGNYATKDMCVSKVALTSVLDAVDAETETDAKFNALITGLRNLVNA